jgi:hypothetical protein
MPSDMVFAGLLSILHWYFSAKAVPNLSISSKLFLRYFFSSCRVLLPIDSRVMNMSTIGLPLALPGYFAETAYHFAYSFPSVYSGY